MSVVASLPPSRHPPNVPINYISERLALALEMSIKIQLDHHLRDWYTGGDKLKGQVLLHLSRETAVESIIVSVYGISYTTVEKKLDGSTITGGAGCVGNEREYCVVLDELVHVFPSHGLDQGTKYTLQAGDHSFPFETVLPLYAMPQGSIGSKARQAEILPPSCSDEGDQMVQYFIKAKASRDSSWGSLACHQFFTFLPSDDAGLCNEQCSVQAKGVLEKAWWNIVGSAAKSCNSHRWELKGKPTATPQIPYIPELWVSFLAEESLEIGSIEIRLEVNTNVKARHLKDNFTQSLVLLKLKPKLKVSASKSPVKVPLDLVLTVPDKVPPTFHTANIRRSYKLSCFIKYQHQMAVSNKHSVDLVLPIQILSGISTPNWETGIVEEISRTFPMNGHYYSHRDRGIAIV